MTNKIIKMRKQTLDWLSEVCKRLEINNATFFNAMEIIDATLKAFDYELRANDFHLISITALFISVKAFETNQLSLKYVYESIAYKKFSKEDIKAAELLILKKLHFKLPKNGFQDYISVVLNNIYPQNASETEEIERNIIFNLCECVYKQIVVGNYRLVANSDLKELFTAVISFSLDFYASRMYLSKNRFTQFFYDLNVSSADLSLYENEIKIIFSQTEKGFSFSHLEEFINNYLKF